MPFIATLHVLVQDGISGSVLAGNLIELRNGCICCTVKDDLVTTLEGLLLERSRFDYIIIETTGLANPVRLSRLMLVPMLMRARCFSACRLDAQEWPTVLQHTDTITGRYPANSSPR